MIARGKFHVVNMETRQPVGVRGQMFRVVDEAEVGLDLRVANVVPVINRRGKFRQQRLKIGFDRQFLDGLTDRSVQ